MGEKNKTTWLLFFFAALFTDGSSMKANLSARRDDFQHLITTKTPRDTTEIFLFSGGPAPWWSPGGTARAGRRGRSGPLQLPPPAPPPRPPPDGTRWKCLGQMSGNRKLKNHGVVPRTAGEPTERLKQAVPRFRRTCSPPQSSVRPPSPVSRFLLLLFAHM